MSSIRLFLGRTPDFAALISAEELRTTAPRMRLFAKKWQMIWQILRRNRSTNSAMVRVEEDYAK